MKYILQDKLESQFTDIGFDVTYKDQEMLGLYRKSDKMTIVWDLGMTYISKGYATIGCCDYNHFMKLYDMVNEDKENVFRTKENSFVQSFLPEEA